MSRRIYLASSWRNAEQPAIVAALREAGHEVYDFRNPHPGDHGFAWSEIDPNWLGWDPETYRDLLDDPVAVAGYGSDFDAMQWADTFVLVLPCGRSAHLELGWATGQGKHTAILLSPNGFEPELMYRMVDLLATNLTEVTSWLDTLLAPEHELDGSPCTAEIDGWAYGSTVSGWLRCGKFAHHAERGDAEHEDSNTGVHWTDDHRGAIAHQDRDR